MDTSHFSQCFDKHNFEELNNLDVNILYEALLFYKNKFPNSNGSIFDIGCNAGSFVKVLQRFNIQSNIVEQ
jgi:hypothetical protein